MTSTETHGTAPTPGHGATADLADEHADSSAGAPDRGRRRRRLVRTIALLVVTPLIAAAIAIGLVRMFRPHAYAGTVLQAPTRAPSMEGLTLTDGSPVDLDAWRGDVVVVFFGYTHCPDVCPASLANAANAVERIGDRDRVHVLMISVDPERDTLDHLEEYVTAFDPAFEGATGDLDSIERVAATYGIFFAKANEDQGDDYTMDHTATLLGIDTDGRLRIVWPSEVDAEALAGDIEELL